MSGLRRILVVLLAAAAFGAAPPVKEDSLPPGAIRRFGSTRLRHPGLVGSLVFLHDSRVLVSHGEDGTVRSWDSRSGNLLRVFSVPRKIPLPVAFSPGGKLLAAWDLRGILLLDVASGKVLHRIGGLRSPIRSLCFSADSRSLAGVRLVIGERHERELCVWETDTGKLIRTFKVTRGEPGYSVAFADGKKIASWSDDGVRLQDYGTGKVIASFKPAGNRWPHAFVPGTSLFVFLSNRDVELWDVRTGREVRSFTASKHWISLLSVSPDGKLLVTSDKEAVRVFDIASGKLLRELGGYRGDASSVAFSPDGKQLATSSWNTIRLWDVQTGKERFPEPILHGGVCTVRLSAEGGTLATLSDRIACVWNVRTGTFVRKLEGTANRYLLAKLTGTWFRELGKTNSPYWSLLRANDENWWDTGILSADGRTLLTWHDGSSSGELSLRNSESGKILKRLEWTNRSARSPLLALSFDGTLAAASTQRSSSIDLWETATGKERPQFRLPDKESAGITSLAFLPGGNLLVAGTSGGQVYLLDPRQGSIIAKLAGHTGAVSALACSSDGRVLATGGSERIIRLLEVSTLKERARFTGHEGSILSLSFARGGRLLASGSSDTTVLLWDVWRADRQHRSFDALWKDLGSSDAKIAFRAARAWRQARGHGVRQFQARIHPAAPLNKKKVARLIGGLDADTYAAREQASDALLELGEQIAPDLERALHDKPSVEMRRRLVRLLRRVRQRILAGEELRLWRAVEVLEQTDSPGAERLLERLCRGDPAHPITREAKAALARWKDAR
jgi:WD40 repeat protein